MLRLVVFVYVFSFIYLIFKMHDFISTVLLLLSIPVVVGLYIAYKKARIKSFKQKIHDAQELVEQGKFEEIQPFVNINTAPSYIIELIPGVQKVYALRAQNQRRKNIYFSSFEEFADFCSLELNFYTLIKRIIKF